MERLTKRLHSGWIIIILQVVALMIILAQIEQRKVLSDKNVLNDWLPRGHAADDRGGRVRWK